VNDLKRKPPAGSWLHPVTVEDLIADGRRAGRSSREIAEQILALTEDPSWAKAMSHPLRGAILQILRREKSTSPRQASRELEASLGTVSYHFRALQSLGLIEICKQIPRRGAVEHFYRIKSLRPGRSSAPLTAEGD